MLVYVLSKNGQPLMPTHRYGFVRRLLNSQKAKVIRRCPFTIQLQYDTSCKTQPVTLGIDAGSRHIGVSATTESKVLYEADIELDIDEDTATLNDYPAKCTWTWEIISV